MNRTTLINYLVKTATLGAQEVHSSHTITTSALRGVPAAALPSYISSTERWLRGKVYDEIMAKGRVLVAWSGFIWEQHVEDALTRSVNGESIESLPFIVADGFAEGYSHLSVSAWGWTLPLIQLEESDR